MAIQCFKIKNYKSIEEVTIDLKNKKLIPLIGINNVGKTNILEALNAIKGSRRGYYWNHKNHDQPNFRVVDNYYLKNENHNIPTNFDFEVECLFSDSKFTEKFFINKDNKKNAIPLLDKLVNKNINSFKNIMKNHFKNKYFLQRDFDFFIENLKKVLENPSEIHLYQAENYFPFDQNLLISNNDDKLKKSFKDFLLNSYVFSSKEEIEDIITKLFEFINNFRELKKTILNHDLSSKIFYICTSLENYEEFKIFSSIDLSKKNIELDLLNNYLTPLIYFNKDWKNILIKIESLLNNKSQSKNEEFLKKINEILKKEFLLDILNDDSNNYVVYPSFYIDRDKFLNSKLILKNNNLECEENIALISQGLRNKLFLKLNLEYCKKYSDREIILLLDEPDQGLHISAILQLYKELKKITEETKTKIIYTTHSPYLLGHIFETYQDILIVEKNKNNKTVVKSYSENNKNELTETALGKEITITGNDYLVINAMNHKDFKYITVEGKTDHSFYTWYNKNYVKDKNLHFISINGKFNTKLINFLKISNLKYISLYDNDYKNNNFIDKKRIIKYNDVFSHKKIKDLETLLKNIKDEHLTLIKSDDFNKLNDYYQKLLQESETEENIKELFTYLKQKFGELND
ncbi:hypothetical protein LT335_00651 [Spiroplasma sp. JKS002669]|uniref:AAA family ATPase n=1 Tax=Spiroplasma attinicola TaxID=2904537 RepID=UPI0020BDF8F6|nr:AAA family ATPase [Spiroplasma sp. JKS002669]MCL6429089.1 hypothetical protein [Spiroplasma sp. JKS002669]